jgi:molybdenum cofactor cytidylyltransferase
VIAAIVLSAGFARRMGRQKLLLVLNGKPVVRWSVEGALPHVGDCVVVTGQDDAAVRGALAGLAVRFAVNARPQDGQGSSIAVGASALPPATASALVVLGDQPCTPPNVIPALLAAQRASGKAIVAPSYRGVRGTPVLFAASVFPELRRLGGDAGARSVLLARPERVEVVEFEAAMPGDVDTPEDFARLHESRENL